MRCAFLSLVVVLTACGDDPASDADAAATDAAVLDGRSPQDPDATPTPTEDCFAATDDIVVIEAESLPIVDDWRIRSEAGVTFIEWAGDAHNQSSAFGRFGVSLEIVTPGVYRLQWRTRIGMGTNTTEHNDTWVRIPDAAMFYARKDGSHAYPRPQCEDAAFLAARLEEPEVEQARCPAGSSHEGFFKVYSSGASDWKWSANTFDHDAHRVLARFDTAGTYTLELAARADFSQIDRIVIHLDELADGVVRDEALAETRCE